MVLKKQISLKVKKVNCLSQLMNIFDDILTDARMHDFFEYISLPHVSKDNKCLDVYIYVVAIITLKYLRIIFH